MQVILMPPIPHQDITEMVQQKQYIRHQDKSPFLAPASQWAAAGLGQR